MILSIVVILFVGIIAYFYFVQGVLTATLSALASTLAAVLAISYFEPVTTQLFQTKFVDSGNAVALIGIYAISFVVLRVLFDKIIPGNVRLQSTSDRVGGGVMGVVVGIFTMGIFAIAAQSMPFGPLVMAHGRYKTSDTRSVEVPGSGQATDEVVTDEMASETFSPDDHQTLLLPVDDWAIEFVSYLSNGGSLAGNNLLTAAHPALLDEYFGQRIGIQPGASHVAINSGTRHSISVPLAYVLPQVKEADAEIKALRVGTLRSLKPEIKSEAGNDILVIRMVCSTAAADSDQMVRLSPGAVRLVVDGINYTPLGTLDSAGTLLLDKPDDPLIIGLKGADAGADLVFFVPASQVLQNGSTGKKGAETLPSFAAGAFLEVKREARIELSTVKFTTPQAPDASLNVMRKKGIGPAPVEKRAAMAPTNDSVALGNDVFEMGTVEFSSKLFHSVAVGLFDGTSADVTFASGTAHVADHQFTRCKFTPTTLLKNLGEGDNSINVLAVPAGMRMVQVSGTPPAKTDDPWTWATTINQFSLLDSAGTPHKPAGAFAKVLKSQQPMMIGSYETTGLSIAIAKVEDARPTDVWLMFLTPQGAGVRQLDYADKMLAPINLPG